MTPLSRAMSHLEVRRILGRHALAMLVIQGIFVSIAVSLSVIAQRAILQGMAKASVSTVDLFLVEGRLAEGLVPLSELRPDFFSVIALFDENGRMITQRAEASAGPVEGRLSHPGLLEGKIVVPLRTAISGSGAKPATLAFLYDYSIAVIVGLTSWVVFALLTLPIFWNTRRRIRGLYDAVIDREKDAAIARVTQMLAHDVRRPFSLLRSTMSLLSSSTSAEKMREVALVALPEIDSAMKSVQGLIADVMEVGSQAVPVREPVRPESLLDAAVTELMRLHPEAQVQVAYELRHEAHVAVDATKVLRVFSNILNNGIEAMGGRGAIRIRTESVVEGNSSLIHFTLGNDGPPIPAEHIPSLFDSFFTSGKRGGTGLGLAIAHKIVTAHGGRIWCESGTGIGVAFHFTLPASAPAITPSLEGLPRTPGDVAHLPAALSDSSPSGTWGWEARVREALQRKPLRILIVEDESLYRVALIEELRRDTDMETRLDVREAKSAEEAFGVLKEWAPDLGIFDVDLGRGSMNGFELARQCRALGHRFHICMHTNRALAGDHKTAIEAGADALLPKPMSRAHLLKLLCEAAEGDAESLTPKPETDALRIAVADDDMLVRLEWQDVYPTAEVFETPEELLVALESTPEKIGDWNVVVLDNSFGRKSNQNGLELGKALRARGYRGRLFLASHVQHGGDYGGIFDREIGKAVPGPEALRALMEK